MHYRSNSDRDYLPFPEECCKGEDNRDTQNYIAKLEHRLFYLYVYLASQEICDEACDFLEKHEDDPIPFRL